MPAISMISEEGASPQVRELYKRIRETLSLPKVPNIFRAMAHTPTFLCDMLDNHVKVMGSGALDRQTKEMLALAVSAVMGCNYCVAVHSAVGQRVGLTEAQVSEVLALAAIISSHNHFQKFKDNAGDDETFKPMKTTLAESLTRQKSISTVQTEMINMLVSAINACHTCVRHSVSRAKQAGATPAMLAEALAVMNLLVTYTTFVKTLGVEIDIF